MKFFKCPNSHKDFICGNCFAEFDLVEKKQKCKHPKEKIHLIHYCNHTTGSGSYYECECGAKVRPSEFEEIND